MKPLALFLVALWVLTGTSTFAQNTKDPSSAARIHLGPLALNPTIAISNVGVDTNVFNEWEDPKQDFTATTGPQADWWVHLGRARLHGKDVMEFAWFAHYSSERSVNTNNGLTLDVPLVRIRPYVTGSYLNTRERPGYEIDARARRAEVAAKGGIEVTVSPRLHIDASAGRRNVSFAGDAVFLGTYLDRVLTRRVDNANATFRYALTPLTNVVLTADLDRNRFAYSPVRDANSVRAMAGLQLDPLALIDGSASIGSRTLNMLDVRIPDFTGLVASIDIGYTLLGATRFAFGFDRDIDYSFIETEPYYLMTSINASITRRVTGTWDVMARSARRQLAYRHASLTSESPPDWQVGAITERHDKVLSWGAGVGYHVGTGTRVGFNVDYYQRSDIYRDRQYRGIRAGTSVTYGF